MSSSPDFLGDEQQDGSVSRINPFVPNLLLGYDDYAGIDSKPGVYNSNFMLRLGIAF